MQPCGLQAPNKTRVSPAAIRCALLTSFRCSLNATKEVGPLGRLAQLLSGIRAVRPDPLLTVTRDSPPHRRSLCTKIYRHSMCPTGCPVPDFAWVPKCVSGYEGCIIPCLHRRCDRGAEPRSGPRLHLDAGCSAGIDPGNADDRHRGLRHGRRPLCGVVPEIVGCCAGRSAKLMPVL